jgi:hypothetical protein
VLIFLNDDFARVNQDGKFGAGVEKSPGFIEKSVSDAPDSRPKTIFKTADFLTGTFFGPGSISVTI